MEYFSQGKIKKAMNMLFPLLLFFYAMRHLSFGVEWWDTGYNYANFTYMDRMDSMWFFSTFLANCLGHLFTLLPFGNYMMGLNFYTGLVVASLALISYFFFVSRIKMPPVLVFLGEVIALGLCWCPSALLYNYLTYLLMLLAVICLYQALREDKTKWFVVAGVLLGVSVFVRFSNLAQMAFIVGVWAYAVIAKKDFKTVLRWTGTCVAGFVLGMGVIFGYIAIRYGVGTYVEAIQRLFGMTEEATSYTMTSMVVYQLQNYLQNFIWLAKMLPFVVLGMLGFRILPDKFVKIKKVGFLVSMLLVFYWLRNQNMFNMKYSTKLSVFQWGVCLLSFTLVLGVITIFSKKESHQDKLLCGFSILIMVLTPLGSNNHLYASINNLFFVAPVILWMLWKLCRKASGSSIVLWPGKATVGLILAMLLVQSVGFGFGYVFSEGDGGENLHTKIEKCDILNGMRTDEIRAAQLGTLAEFVQQQNLTGRDVILFGQIPAVSYYLEMPYAISPWPDLASYSYAVMAEDLEKVKENIGSGSTSPVLLLERTYGELLLQDADQSEPPKLQLIRGFARELGYELYFENEKFMLFLVP